MRQIVTFGAMQTTPNVSTLLDANLEAGRGSKKVLITADVFDREISDDQWRAQVLRLARRLPALGVPNDKKGVVDLYDVSDDWIPIYDQTDLPGSYVTIGTSGNQFKNCHIAAYCMVQLINTVEGGRDHDADPVTVTMSYTGLEMDMSVFSRNREINADSSFSVLG